MCERYSPPDIMELDNLYIRIKNVYVATFCVRIQKNNQQFFYSSSAVQQLGNIHHFICCHSTAFQLEFCLPPNSMSKRIPIYLSQSPISHAPSPAQTNEQRKYVTNNNKQPCQRRKMSVKSSTRSIKPKNAAIRLPKNIKPQCQCQ